MDDRSDKLKKIDGLAKTYFSDELGLSKNEIQNASKNLLGFFEMLIKIEERIRKDS